MNAKDLARFLKKCKSLAIFVNFSSERERERVSSTFQCTDKTENT